MRTLAMTVIVFVALGVMVTRPLEAAELKSPGPSPGAGAPQGKVPSPSEFSSGPQGAPGAPQAGYRIPSPSEFSNGPRGSAAK